MDAIILVGGLGTRLRTVISDIPKPMAPIGDKPFLEYIFKLLAKYNYKKVILAVGYKNEIITQYFKKSYLGIEVCYSVEEEPLGTGGAIKKACANLTCESVLLLNGDTFFNVDFSLFSASHQAMKSDLTLALKPMSRFSRYGNVLIDSLQRVYQFEEKKYVDSGYINGGVYQIKPSVFDKFRLPDKFSFERDFLEKYLTELHVHAFVSDSYFIDIGIPEDYNKAQIELPNLFGG